MYTSVAAVSVNTGYPLVSYSFLNSLGFSFDFNFNWNLFLHWPHYYTCTKETVVFGDHCVLRFLFYFALGLRLPKIKIWFSDLLFDAVRCFSGFSSENIRLNDLNRVHVYSDFACGLVPFWSTFTSVCGFLLLFTRFCGFVYTPKSPSVSQNFKENDKTFKLISL